jgi:uncharacterized C2H2 Zn-finger protein
MVTANLAALRREIVAATADRLLERLFADQEGGPVSLRASGKPDGVAPITLDEDGDLHCPECSRIFVSRAAFKQHMTKTHGASPVRVRPPRVHRPREATP